MLIKRMLHIRPFLISVSSRDIRQLYPLSHIRPDTRNEKGRNKQPDIRCIPRSNLKEIFFYLSGEKLPLYPGGQHYYREDIPLPLVLVSRESID